MSEMIFAQDWSGIDATKTEARKDPVHGPVTVFLDVVIAREIVQAYDFDGKILMAYKSADELEQYWPWVDGRWAIAGRHPDTPVIVSPGDIAGRTINPRFVKNLKDSKTGRPNIRGILVDLEVFNDRVTPDVLRGMKDGSLPSVSIGFLYAKEMTPGHWNGADYDFRQVKMFHDHLAFGISKGRCAFPACGIGADELFSLSKTPTSGESMDLNALYMKKKIALIADIRSGIKSTQYLNEKDEPIDVDNMVIVGHDPEETEETIRIPNPGGGDCEVTATIMISEEQGIQAAYCGESETIRTYIFSKDKDWTREKAQAWVDKHKEDAGDTYLKRLIEIDAAGDQDPPTDVERALAYYGITAELWDSLSAEAKSALIAALPEETTSGEGGEDAMTEDELTAKIAEIQEKIDAIYAETPDNTEITVLYAEKQAYEEALTAMIKARVIPEEEEEMPAEDTNHANYKKEVERTKRLLSDHRLKHDPLSR